MIDFDMNFKRKKALAKVKNAIEINNGHTLLSTGMTGDDARLAKAVTDVGVKMLEPNHPAYALAKGYKGVTTMDDAEDLRYEIKLEEMADIVKGVRSVVPDDVYITVGVPGSFTEMVPVELTDEDLRLLSISGADGLHTHKSSIEDLADIVELAHRNGLLVDAYIGKASDKHMFGVPAETLEDVAKTAKAMEDIGVDMIGMMTGMSYGGAAAGEIPEEIRKRLEVLIDTVSVPTIAEGGINVDNYEAFKGTGVDIIVVGTAIDDMVEAAAQEAVKTFLYK